MHLQRFEELQQEFEKLGMHVCCEEPLAKHTTFRIGGPARLFCAPNSEEQFVCVINLCKQAKVRHYILGKGSNLLFSDDGFSGVVLSTGGLSNTVQIEPDGCVRAGAGIALSQLCQQVAKAGLTGLEFAYGIPGSLGGAVYMNAGAYGGEMKDVLSSVRFLSDEGTIVTLPLDQLHLGYRTSLFSETGACVLQAQLQLAPGDRNQIEEKMNDLMSRRKSKQPLEYPSGGSTFKRPEGAFAGALIEQCGLRGYRVGGAAISEKHCGFVVNLGGATCADVLQLTREVRELVKKKTGYILEKEIRVVE